MAPLSFEDLVAKHFQALPTDAEARRAAELKKKYRAFVEAINDPSHSCFCQWVDKRTARNWRGPQFWGSLRYCATHKKMGFREKSRVTAEVPPSKADLKDEYTKFVEAINDPKQLCFCRWVDSSSAKSWKGPKFWNDLRYCYTHEKMGLNDVRRKQDGSRRQREAALVRYNTFRAAIDNLEHPCFCQWVDVPEAQNWRGPKFWDQLQHCKTHDKNGVRRGTLGQNGRRRKRHTVIIDLVDSSDEERSEGAERTITEQSRRQENTDRRKRRKINAEINGSGFLRSEIPKVMYSRHTIATDILRSAGIHPTLPPLNWWTDPNLLDIKTAHQVHRQVLKNSPRG
jgi:hypothetical protein